VDDLRPRGPSKEGCWQATIRVGCQLNHNGLQDAARKQRPAVQYDGSWAGNVVHNTNDRVSVMVTEKRWIKIRTIIWRLVDEMI
jgi:hypothetical protein